MAMTGLKENSALKEELKEYSTWHRSGYGTTPEEAAEEFIARLQERRARKGNQTTSRSPSPGNTNVFRQKMKLLCLYS